MGRAEQLRVADFHCDVLSKLQASPILISTRTAGLM